ncbi:MAG TPA: hypothetical protein VMW75_13565, partial [Thermoanaerobaculia bacterium]|nr:hypothetical protein [Thermoanaerobaculia bacterium]
MRTSTRCCAVVVAALALGATAAAAAPPAPIQKGVDLWMTVAGFARTNLADDPIPAGFFCSASQPFAGTITFKGVPLAMDPPNSLGKMDTAVRRLDDA